MKKIIYTASLVLAVQLTVSAQDHSTAPKQEAPKKQGTTTTKSTKHESESKSSNGDSKSEVSNAPAAASSNTNEGTATPTKRKTRMAVNEKGVPK